MFFAFGVAFEVPIAVVLLVLTGIVTVEKLQERARLRAHRHFRDRGDPHAAGCGFPVHHGHTRCTSCTRAASHGAYPAEDAARGAERTLRTR